MPSLVARSEWDEEKVELAPEKWAPFGPDAERFCLPDGEPVRLIVTGRRNRKVGAHYSWKLRRHVVVESTPEDRAARLFDCHPDVDDVRPQPETVRFRRADGRLVRYTPDFLVTFRGGLRVRFEIKRLIDLRPLPPKDRDDERGVRTWQRAARMRRHLRDVREVYRAAGRVWLPLLDVDVLAAGEAEVVDEIVADGGRHMGPEDRLRLLAHLRENGGQAPLASCAAVVLEGEYPRGAVLARIIDGGLAVDLTRPLDDDTTVRLASGFLQGDLPRG